MKALLAAFVRNPVLPGVITILVLAAGLVATLGLVREDMPIVADDLVLVEVEYPGASPAEVEESVCARLEQAVAGLAGVKEYTSVAREDWAELRVVVDYGQKISDVLERVRSQVDAISTFPAEVRRPATSMVMHVSPVLFLHLGGGESERSLKELAFDIRDELRGLEEVSQVEVLGARDYEISVEVPADRLRQHGLSLPRVAAAIRSGNLNLDGGRLRSRQEEVDIRTVGRKYEAGALAGIGVLALPGGESLTLGRLADIRDGFAQDVLEMDVDGRKSLVLAVSKTLGEDEISISGAVRDYLAGKGRSLPPGISLDVLYDASRSTRNLLWMLGENSLWGLAIVLALLWLFLDGRAGFWAAMSIPISLAGAVAVFWGLGGSLNMVTILSAILVLGILVDDSIVVSEAVRDAQERGLSAREAAVAGTARVALPLCAAVLTTMAAFVPLFYVRGHMGKFIAILPTVVIVALGVSLLEAFLLLPAHLSAGPGPGTGGTARRGWRAWPARIRESAARRMAGFRDRRYAPALRVLLEWRYATLSAALCVVLLSLGLVLGGFVPFEVFPSMGAPTVTASVELPNGAPAEAMRSALGEVRASLARAAGGLGPGRAEPVVAKRLTVLGQLPGDKEIMPNLGYVQAILSEEATRDIHAKDLAAAWEREIGDIPGARAVRVSFGDEEGMGRPIEVRLSGRDMAGLDAAADRIAALLRSFDGVYGVSDDAVPGRSEIRLSLRPEARHLGLTLEDLAGQVKAGFHGEEAVRVQRGREEVKIMVRYPEAERTRASSLETMRICAGDGRMVPLYAVAHATAGPGYATVTRYNGQRRIMVSAGLDRSRANAMDIAAELERRVPALRADHPGVSFSLEGEEKNHSEPFASLAVGFPLALLAIYLIMAATFGSYVQPLVILSTVPLGLVGAVLGHLAMGLPLSMLSMFGMVALAGVVVNDAIVLVSQVNAGLADGLDLRDAVLRAARGRFRAIFLTSVTTIGGLAPLISETALEAIPVVPMALSLASGLAFATVLTLLVIPCLLLAADDLGRLARGLWRGAQPAPARQSFPELLTDKP